MPQSRKRKRKTHPSARVASSRSKANKPLKVIVIVALAALLVGAAVLLVLPHRNGIAGQEITTTSGLKYIDEVVGTGASPRPGATVKVDYTGTLLDGTKFDSSKDSGRPLEFVIGTGRVIKGWDEGVMSMKVGGKRRLIVPPDLGYGARGFGQSIPPNATLQFEVELLDVKL